jgi:GDP-L-fucose synthase
MLNYESDEIINVGTGEDITIAELADLIRSAAGFKGEIIYDTTKPDGTPRKLLDVSKINTLGWKSKIGLREGILSTYRWYVESIAKTSPAIA